MATAMAIRIDASGVQPVIDELSAIIDRCASLPEFAEFLLKIREGLGNALETRWVNFDGGAAGAGDRLLRLELTQEFLDLAMAVRAFDRNRQFVADAHDGPRVGMGGLVADHPSTGVVMSDSAGKITVSDAGKPGFWPSGIPRASTPKAGD